MDVYLRFQNAIFCSSNCNFLNFLLTNCLYQFNSIQFFICTLFITDLFTFLLIFYHRYSKYNPWGLIFGRGWGGAYTWKEFSVSKVGS